MNTIVKNKLVEAIRSEVSSRLASKGVKISEKKMQAIVEASLIRKKGRIEDEKLLLKHMKSKKFGELNIQYQNGKIINISNEDIEKL